LFGYVTPNMNELSPEARQRYYGIYCGICRSLRESASPGARLGLSFDMAFLALLLMSLYEPEESEARIFCPLHPFQKRRRTDSPYVRYAADMNILLGYHKAMDDVKDDHSLTGRCLAGIFSDSLPRIREDYPRQWEAVEQCLAQLGALEKENCPNPDLPAACFGRLMGELLVFQEDHWAPTLRQMGMALGRFVYLADAAADYPRDRKKGRYNPFLAMDSQPTVGQWEDYLLQEMARCTQYYEILPLVQDKPLLDNILYSGVWMKFQRLRPGKNGAQEERA